MWKNSLLFTAILLFKPGLAWSLEDNKLEHTTMESINLELSTSLENANLTCVVTVLDSRTARVTWSLTPSTRPIPSNIFLEITFSPVASSYYTVIPMVSPLDVSPVLENLLPFTDYKLMMRMYSKDDVVESDIVYFRTNERASSLSAKDPSMMHVVQPKEVVLISLVLLVWVGAIAIFVHRWGKIRQLLPYQPVYSKPLYEQVIHEEPRLTSVIDRNIGRHCDCVLHKYQMFGSTGHLGCHSAGNHGFTMEKSNSTIIINQPNSLDVDADNLRKTRSAESVCTYPRIVIDKILTPDGETTEEFIPKKNGRNTVTPFISVASPYRTNLEPHHSRSPSHLGVECVETTRSRSRSCVETYSARYGTNSPAIHHSQRISSPSIHSSPRISSQSVHYLQLNKSPSIASYSRGDSTSNPAGRFSLDHHTSSNWKRTATKIGLQSVVVNQLRGGWLSADTNMHKDYIGRRLKNCERERYGDRCNSQRYHLLDRNGSMRNIGAASDNRPVVHKLVKQNCINVSGDSLYMRQLKSSCNKLHVT